MTIGLNPLFDAYELPVSKWKAIGNIAGTQTLNNCAGGPNGQFMVASGTTAGTVYYSSDYGLTWSAKTTTATAVMYGMEYYNGYWYTAEDAGNILCRSSDTTTWTTLINKINNNNTDHHTITYNDGYFVLGTGNSGGNGNICGADSTGATWAQSTSAGANSVYCGIYVGTLNRTFSFGQQTRYYNGPPYPAISSWTGNPSGLSGSARAVTWSSALGLAVCCNTAGSIFYSSDLISWTAVSLGATALRFVKWLADIKMFIVVGDSGYIATSYDGINWTTRTSGTTNALRGIAYSASTTGPRIILTGDAGTVLTNAL